MTKKDKCNMKIIFISIGLIGLCILYLINNSDCDCDN